MGNFPFRPRAGCCVRRWQPDPRAGVVRRSSPLYLPPYWLTREECLALHDMMLSHFGGIAGLRDENLLESALAKPRQLFHDGKQTKTDFGCGLRSGHREEPSLSRWQQAHGVYDGRRLSQAEWFRVFRPGSGSGDDHAGVGGRGDDGICVCGLAQDFFKTQMRGSFDELARPSLSVRPCLLARLGADPAQPLASGGGPCSNPGCPRS